MGSLFKGLVASRLLSSELVKGMMEDVEMAVYDRDSHFGYVYSNLGDLIKKVQAVGATTSPTLFHHAMTKKTKSLRLDGIEQLKENVSRLQEMQSRLGFMLDELETLVKKR